MTVENCDRIESAAKPANRLRGQTDFWNQHNGLPPITDDFFDRSNVNFCLAAARDPVKQQCSVLAGPDNVKNRFHGACLIVVQNNLAMGLDRVSLGSCKDPPSK